MYKGQERPEENKMVLMEETIMFKKSTKVMSAIAAAVLSVTALSATANAYVVQPPMHNQYGQPVTNYNQTVRIVQPVNNNTRRNNTIVNTTIVNARVPSYVAGYRLTSTGNVNSNITFANYGNGSKSVIFRKAKGSTGLNYSYPGTFRTGVNGVSVVYKGTNQGYFTATWSRGQFNYIIKSSHPLDPSQMNALVAAMINA